MPVISTIAAATARAFGAFKAAAGGAADEFFKYVTLLLHGDGTNGAQNNTFLDSSTNNFTITRNGNTTQGTFSPFSQTGWSNYFDGSGDYLRYATNTSAPFSLGTSDFTDEVWVFPTAFAVGSSVISCQTQTNGSAGNGYALYLNGSGQPGLLVAASSGGYTVNFVGTAIPLNTWTHLAVTRSGNTFTLWRNGVSDGTATSSVSISQDATSGYGGWNVGGSPQTGQSHNGYISNARLVKGTAVYTGNFTPSTTPLTAISGTSLLTCQSNRFRDASSNNFAITVNGNTSVQAFSPFAPTAAYSTATVGGSGYFDGSGDYLSVPSNTAFAFGTGAWTMECWVYASAIDVTSVFFSCGTNGAQFGSNSSGNLGIAQTGVAFEVNSSTALPLNQWNHVVAVRNGSNSTSIFLNGTRIANATITTNYSSSGTAYINYNPNSTSSDFTGYMSGLRIVKGTAVYDPTQTTITVPTAPLTAIANTQLLTNFTNAGIFDNTAKNVLETVGNAQISTSVKKYGTGSMYFDGTGDWLAAPPTPQTDLGSGDFTIECWLYRTASGAASDSGIASRGAPSTSNGFVFGYTSANVLTFNFNYSGSIVTGSTAIALNTWTHVAVSRSGTTFKLFVNGVVDATATSSNSQTTNASDIFYVGRSGFDSGRIVTGYIDDLRITKGIARYTSNFTPPTAAFADQ